MFIRAVFTLIVSMILVEGLSYLLLLFNVPNDLVLAAAILGIVIIVFCVWQAFKAIWRTKKL